MSENRRDRRFVVLVFLLLVAVGAFLTWTCFPGEPGAVLEKTRDQSDDGPALEGQGSAMPRRFASREQDLHQVEGPPQEASALDDEDDRVRLDLQVLDAEGRPLSDAEIRVDIHSEFVSALYQEYTMPKGEIGRTDPDGCYRSLDAGRVFLVCAIVDGRRASPTRVFKYPRGRVTLRLKAEATLRVRVMDDAGRIATDARVLVAPHTSTRGMRRWQVSEYSLAATDAQGTRSTTIEVGHAYKVVAEMDRMRGDPVDVVATRSGEIVEITISTRSRHRLCADVLDEFGQPAKVGRVVVVEDLDGSSSADELPFQFTGSVTAGGRLDLPLGAPGTFRAFACDGRGRRSATRTFTVTDDSPEAELEFEMRPAPWRLVRILDSEGRPVVGARVEVHADALQPASIQAVLGMLRSHETRMRAATNAFGEFRLQVTHDDLDYIMKIEQSGPRVLNCCRRGIRFQDDVVEVRLRPVDERGLRVSGRLRASDGHTEIPETTVSLASFPLFTNSLRISGEGGVAIFDFQDVSAGDNYELFVTVPGFQPITHHIHALDRDLDLDFDLKPCARLEMTFVDDEGRGLPYFEFLLKEKGGGNRASAHRFGHADTQGRAEQDDLSHGTYTIRDLVTRRELGEVEVSSGQTTTIRVIVN